MPYFDAIYVINLPARRDRRAQMNDQFLQVGIDPASSQVIFFDAVRPDDAGGFPTIGTRGCFLSHVGVLQQASAAGHQRILILEDDVNFSSDFVARFAQMTAELERSEWDFWYLGALSVTPPLADAPALAALPPTSAVMGSHMIALKAHVIDQLLPYFEAMLQRQPGDPAGGPMHVDGAYGWFRRARPRVVTLLATPALGYQRPSRTDVHALKWFDRIPIVDKAIGLLRNARARLAGPH